MRRGTSLAAVVLAAVAGFGGCGGSLAGPEGGADAIPEGGVDVTNCTQVTVQATGTSCRYAVPAPPVSDGTIDRASIGVLVAGTEIPRDPNHLNGWDYLDATMETMEIYGPTCDAVTASPIPVTIIFKCLIL